MGIVTKEYGDARGRGACRPIEGLAADGPHQDPPPSGLGRSRGNGGHLGGGLGGKAEGRMGERPGPNDVVPDDCQKGLLKPGPLQYRNVDLAAP